MKITEMLEVSLYMIKTYTICSVAEMHALPARLVEDFPGSTVWLLSGDLGAGKTTLVQGLAQHLHAADLVTSPTFSIVQPYLLPEDRWLYHLDLYRLKSAEEAIEIGIEDYLDSGEWCVVEWPELIEPWWLSGYLQLEIRIKTDGCREVSGQLVTLD
ncbi:MAG TPA: tRNA (adenosine(37)-N6)-threonylcarbamoyltransferase complex ATPase subunit type 1 TsaE [Saprospiraceae bacterium]|nr:tRNA (adenosine(37)-N6)-threonylcarbamoyltransferase complex ATPase subunit type 1 TsaE [Saprospiraceae bacterium]